MAHIYRDKISNDRVLVPSTQSDLGEGLIPLIEIWYFNGTPRCRDTVINSTILARHYRKEEL